MKLGIITPLNDIFHISEHTDFTIVLGYMAMRYNEYLQEIQSEIVLPGDCRNVALIQMPGYVIRHDYYFATARRIQPKYMGLAPQPSAHLNIQLYLEMVAAKQKYEELDSTTILPLVGPTDDENSIAIWGETTPRRLLMWDMVEKVPLKFSHGSTILGMIPPHQLQKIRPHGLITAYPILCAQAGLSCFDEDGVARHQVIRQVISPEWVLRPLTDRQLALAVENIKELKSVISK